MDRSFRKAILRAPIRQKAPHWPQAALAEQLSLLTLSALPNEQGISDRRTGDRQAFCNPARKTGFSASGAEDRPIAEIRGISLPGSSFGRSGMKSLIGLSRTCQSGETGAANGVGNPRVGCQLNEQGCRADRPPNVGSRRGLAFGGLKDRGRVVRPEAGKD